MKRNQSEKAEDGGNDEIGNTATDAHGHALHHLTLCLEASCPTSMTFMEIR
ncbi:hypothetical protein [Asaia platycodi]|uniref:hypothetical protein n=1 Tax=Asaia platycodi TaxID=610243 RepID=UPI001F59C609|nr:hypothetical protein [Asaia platycodi]